MIISENPKINFHNPPILEKYLGKSKNYISTIDIGNVVASL
jgi:hypothetical protein